MNKYNEIIYLNVGGVNYATSRSTIMSYPDSMLALMISGSIPSATDSKERIFIDRDGLLFRFILNFLRDKKLNLPTNFNEYEQLQNEADFYRIEPMIVHLNDILIHSKQLCTNSKNSLKQLQNEQDLLFNGEEEYGGQYLTIVSKLYQGSIESMTGCIRILRVFSESLSKNAILFIEELAKELEQKKKSSMCGSSSSNSGKKFKQSDRTLICECKFMYEEKIIYCKPCGFSNNHLHHFQNQNNPIQTPGICQLISTTGRKFGISIGFWDDVFYLPLEVSSSSPNRESLCSLLKNCYKGKLLSSNICDKSADDLTKVDLVERWFLECI